MAQSEVLNTAYRGLLYKLAQTSWQQKRQIYEAVESRPSNETLTEGIMQWAVALGEICGSYASHYARLYAGCDSPENEVVKTLSTALREHLRLGDAPISPASSQWPEDNSVRRFILSTFANGYIVGEDGELSKPTLPRWANQKGNLYRMLSASGNPPSTYLSEEETEERVQSHELCFGEVLLSQVFLAKDSVLIGAALEEIEASQAVASDNPQEIPIGAVQHSASPDTQDTLGSSFTPDGNGPDEARALSPKLARRIRLVQTLIGELNTLRPLMQVPDDDFRMLADENPGYETFKICRKNPSAAQWVKYLPERRRVESIAFELAAIECGCRAATIETNWRHYKPRAKT